MTKAMDRFDAALASATSRLLAHLAGLAEGCGRALARAGLLGRRARAGFQRAAHSLVHLALRLRLGAQRLRNRFLNNRR